MDHSEPTVVQEDADDLDGLTVRVGTYEEQGLVRPVRRPWRSHEHEPGVLDDVACPLPADAMPARSRRPRVAVKTQLIMWDITWLRKPTAFLFDHESPRRGQTFVTGKITRAVARIDAGLRNYVANDVRDERRPRSTR